MKIKERNYAIVGPAYPAEPSIGRAPDGSRPRYALVRGPRWRTNLPVLDLTTPRFRVAYSPAASCA